MSGTVADRARGTVKAYARPTLTVYGDVKKLTASGTSGIAENGNTPNCSGHLDRRPC